MNYKNNTDLNYQNQKEIISSLSNKPHEVKTIYTIYWSVCRLELIKRKYKKVKKSRYSMLKLMFCTR